MSIKDLCQSKIDVNQRFMSIKDWCQSTLMSIKDWGQSNIVYRLYKSK